jgi:hypothetical protein
LDSTPVYPARLGWSPVPLRLREIPLSTAFSPAGTGRGRRYDPAALAGLVVVAYAAFLVGAAVGGSWLVGRDHLPIATDFISFWAAGHLALAGQAASAYDFGIHHAVEVAAVGHDFPGYFSWYYPPTFFFVAAPLAVLPYLPALGAWIVAGLAGFLAAIRLVLPRREAVIFAAAVPVVVWNISSGQNGFLSAGLMAAALAVIDRRPVVAGILIGCLTYKPQFGVLIPIALACGGYWRAFLSAAVTSLVLAGLSLAVFGLDAWVAFLNSIPVAYRTILVDNLIGAEKLQSVFGLVRFLGGSADLAWVAQYAVTVPVTLFVAWVWWRPYPTDLKAAALAAGTALVTPYALIYDLVILIVPVAFLARTGLSRGEAIASLVASLFLLVFVVSTGAVGLPASVIVMGMVVRRVLRASGEVRAAKEEIRGWPAQGRP